MDDERNALDPVPPPDESAPRGVEATHVPSRRVAATIVVLVVALGLVAVLIGRAIAASFSGDDHGDANGEVALVVVLALATLSWIWRRTDVLPALGAIAMAGSTSLPWLEVSRDGFLESRFAWDLPISALWSVYEPSDFAVGGELMLSNVLVVLATVGLVMISLGVLNTAARRVTGFLGVLVAAMFLITASGARVGTGPYGAALGALVMALAPKRHRQPAPRAVVIGVASAAAAGLLLVAGLALAVHTTQLRPTVPLQDLLVDEPSFPPTYLTRGETLIDFQPGDDPEEEAPSVWEGDLHMDGSLVRTWSTGSIEGPHVYQVVSVNASPVTAWFEFRSWVFREPPQHTPAGPRSQGRGLTFDPGFRSQTADEERLLCSGPGVVLSQASDFCQFWTYAARYGQFRVMIVFESYEKWAALADFVLIVAAIEPRASEALGS